MSHIFAAALEVRTELDLAVKSIEHRLLVIREDLRLLGYLYVARFIVWRELTAKKLEIKIRSKN